MTNDGGTQELSAGHINELREQAQRLGYIQGFSLAKWEILALCDMALKSLQPKTERDKGHSAVGVASTTAPSASVVERRLTLSEELMQLLNRHSAEGVSNTPDFVLAEYLMTSLRAVEDAIKTRDSWYGISPQPGAPVPAYESSAERINGRVSPKESVRDQALEEAAVECERWADLEAAHYYRQPDRLKPDHAYNLERSLALRFAAKQVRALKSAPAHTDE